MTLHDYKRVLCRQDDGSWVAEIPALAGCYALMPTREAALAEVGNVFELIAEEYRERGISLPADTTEIPPSRSSGSADLYLGIDFELRSWINHHRMWLVGTGRRVGRHQ